MIEKGLCQCGCGQRTNMSPQTHLKRGLIKGEPYRFSVGHRIRGRYGTEHPMWNGGKSHRNWYSVTLVKDHPRTMNGYVYDHVLKAEKAMGKFLDPSHPIHHFYKYPSNQIVICEDVAFHNFLHMRYRALKNCGHANWRKCEYCHQWDEPINMKWHKHGASKTAYHSLCRQQYRSDQ